MSVKEPPAPRFYADRGAKARADGRPGLYRPRGPMVKVPRSVGQIMEAGGVDRLADQAAQEVRREI